MSPEFEAELDARLQALDLLMAACLQRAFRLDDLEGLQKTSAELEHERSVATPLPDLAPASVFKHYNRILRDAILLAKS